MQENFHSLVIESKLTSHRERLYQPDKYSSDLRTPFRRFALRGHDWRWYKTSCPCCRRPLEVTVTNIEKPYVEWRKGRRAFAVSLWGANAGYALGALVLGQRLRELSPNVERLLLHTDDVPSDYLEASTGLRGATRPCHAAFISFLAGSLG